MSETWALTLRKKETWRVFEDRVVARISVTMREKFGGEPKKMRNEGLHNESTDYSYSDKSRRMT
jgi:hypothetical protein